MFITQLSIVTTYQSKAEGMIWSPLDMFCCIFSGEGRTLLYEQTHIYTVLVFFLIVSEL
jgi:hypothetical protein